MIITVHIPEADVAGRDSCAAIYEALRVVAERLGECVGASLVDVSWEPERLSDAWSMRVDRVDRAFAEVVAEECPRLELVK